MIFDILHEIKNYFEVRKHYGKFEIKDNTIKGPFYLNNNQYFRIIGSVFNDGVYQYNEKLELTDETYEGAIWALAIPPAVIALSSEVEAWQAKYGNVDSVNMSPYTSESFGGYSYSKSGGGSGDGKAGTWQQAFASRLNRWRKI